jgi:hypothetical protein
LIVELNKAQRNCTLLVCDLPVVEGVNGPDDYIGVCGDDAMAEVFVSSYSPADKSVGSSAPKPTAPPLTAEEASALTGKLLQLVYDWVTKYVVVTTEQAAILSVWVLHTYVIDAAEWTPYLHVTGPEKQCGKTLLMDVVAALAANPRTSSGSTPAALLRIVDKYQPTLFLDEIDAATNGNKEMAEAQRGILYAGAKRGGLFYKCDGKDHEVKSFNAFCSKCFAGIGNLPGTVASRSIIIEMRRKLRSERVARYRSREVERLAAPIRVELERWGGGVIHLLKGFAPEPVDALHDRANDVAEILLAVATLAGANWLQRLTKALLAVYGSDAAGDTSTGVTLLSDARDIFAKRDAAHIPSKELAAMLCEMESRPWAEWSHARGLSANNLARLLKKYPIYPVSVRVGKDDTPKGYRRTDFEDAWERYCPLPHVSTATSPQPPSPLDETPFSNRHTPPDVAFAKSAPDPHGYRVCGGVAFQRLGDGRESSFEEAEQAPDENNSAQKAADNDAQEEEEWVG